MLLIAMVFLLEDAARETAYAASKIMDRPSKLSRKRVTHVAYHNPKGLWW